MKKAILFSALIGTWLHVLCQCQFISASYDLKPLATMEYERESRINPLDGQPYQAPVAVLMDVYEPQSKVGEGNPLRPAVILCHGANVRRNDVNMRQLGQSLARRGYIVASIDYRSDQFSQGERDLVTLLCTSAACKRSSSVRTLYSNAMDVHKAISYLLSHYPVNPSQFIIGGHSLGAGTAYMACSITKDEVAAHFPSTFTSSSWYTDFTIHRPRIRGGLLFSGGTLDLTYTDATDAVPMFIYHGTHDPAAPFYSGRQLCGDVTNPILFGGAAIAERMDQLSTLSYYFVEARGIAHSFGIQCDTSAIPNPHDKLTMLWYPDMVRFMRTTMLDGFPNQVHKVLTPNNSSTYDYCADVTNDFCNPGASLLILQQFSSNFTCYAYPAGWPNNSLGTLPWSGPYYPTCAEPYLPMLPNQPTCGLYFKQGEGMDFLTAIVPPAAPTLTLFPNPVSDKLNILMSRELPYDCQLLILDINGRTLGHHAITKGTTEATLQVDTLPPGIYLLHPQVAGLPLTTLRFVKQ